MSRDRTDAMICADPDCKRSVHGDNQGSLSTLCAIHIVRAGGRPDWRPDNNPLVCVCATPDLDGWLMCRYCKRKPAALLGQVPGAKAIA